MKNIYFGVYHLIKYLFKSLSLRRIFIFGVYLLKEYLFFGFYLLKEILFFGLYLLEKYYFLEFISQKLFVIFIYGGRALNVPMHFVGRCSYELSDLLRENP